MVEIVKVYDNVRDTSETVTYDNGCVIQYGGRDGDGFCYGHQDFDCPHEPQGDVRFAAELRFRARAAVLAGDEKLAYQLREEAASL